MSAHPDGTGTGWTLTETIDVDQPQGLDYRALNHLAKAVRKRMGKEHEAFADVTAGGEHVPGWCKILKHVDGTADVSGAKDATFFQNNGIVHSAGNQTLWCITGAASDPTILVLHPSRQYKNGDITWAGAAEFDQSVDFTGPVHIDGVLLCDGSADFTNTCIDGTLDVYDRADFSAIGVTGDSTVTGSVEFDNSVDFTGPVQIHSGGAILDGSVQVNGLMSFCANNVYDSSWFTVAVQQTYAKTHDLSSTALLTCLYFKDVSNALGFGANTVLKGNAIEGYSGLPANYSFGAYMRTVTDTQMTLVTGYHGTFRCWNQATSATLTSEGGQYRIVSMRLV